LRGRELVIMNSPAHGGRNVSGACSNPARDRLIKPRNLMFVG
jgi:hypothetical protein